MENPNKQKIEIIQAKITNNEYPAPSHIQTDTLISIFYTLWWGLHEAFRELTQNMIDEVFAQVINSGFDVIRDIRLVSENGTDFIYYVGPEQIEYGSIRYIRDLGHLILRNKGTLPKSALLLGGGSKTIGDACKYIAGLFGEGMKLAFLALLRLGKQVSILSGGVRYSFSLCQVRKGQKILEFGEPTVHITVTNDNSDTGFVVVTITDVAEDEWKGTPENNQGAHCFLSFREVMGEDIGTVRPLGFPNNKLDLGTVLLGPNVKGKIFVKGIYVCTPVAAQALLLGYNFFDLKLDRDRNVTVDSVQLNNYTTATIGHLLSNYDELRRLYPEIEFHRESIFNRVLDSIMNNHHEVYYIAGNNHLTAAACENLLKRWWARGYGRANIDWPWHDESKLRMTISDIGLSSGIYHHKLVSWLASPVLQKATSFRNPAQFIAEIPKQIYNLNEDENQILANALERLMGIHADLANLQVVFLENFDYNYYFKVQNILYLPKEYLDENKVKERDRIVNTPSETKIMGIISKVLKIPVEIVVGR